MVLCGGVLVRQGDDVGRLQLVIPFAEEDPDPPPRAASLHGGGPSRRGTTRPSRSSASSTRTSSRPSAASHPTKVPYAAEPAQRHTAPSECLRPKGTAVETFTITVEPLGREIECREDQTILDACLRNGVWLLHSCTHGTCATCKCEMLDGDVDHGDASSFALMDFERDEGKLHLLRQAALRRRHRGRPRRRRGRRGASGPGLRRHRRGARGHRAGHPPPGHRARPADVLQRRAVPEVRGAREGRRPDVLDREPTHGAAAARVPHPAHARGLASDGWIFGAMSVGDEVRLSGRTAASSSRWATTGTPSSWPAAPVSRDPARARERGVRRAPHLYQGGRSREWLYDVDEFRRLEAEYPEQFTYRPCLSEETAEEVGADAAAAYGYGLVTDVIAADHASLSGGAGYLCGPPPMVEAALKTLMSKLPPRHLPRGLLRRVGQGVRWPEEPAR